MPGHSHLFLSLAQHGHGPHVDAARQLVLGLLQLLHLATRLLRVVRREVIRRVRLAKVLPLVRDPVVLLQQVLHLVADRANCSVLRS